METSLHRQLKQLYADRGARVEAPLDNYRIDVICEGELIEIQHGSLAAIRRKVQNLLKGHRVLVVKPIILQNPVGHKSRRDRGSTFARVYRDFCLGLRPSVPGSGISCLMEHLKRRVG